VAIELTPARECAYRVQRHLITAAGPWPATYVAARHVGLHAARLSSPWVAMRTRVPTFEAVHLRDLLHSERSLIKLRCMRRTLHILPLDLAAIAHAATLDQRAGACRSSLRRLGHSDRTLRSLTTRVRDHLASSELPYRTLESQLRATCRHSVEMIRLAIKWLWEHGELVYLDRSPSLHHEHRSFALTSHAFPTLELAIGAVEHPHDRLVAAHIQAFGPVSPDDIAWWSGMGSGRVGSALRRLAGELVRVRIAGLGDDLVMHASTVEDALAVDAAPTGQVSLLAYEDPSLKGYSATRGRYVSASNYPQLFNSIGEARASIMLDGHIVGVWSWDRRTASAVHLLFEQLNRTDRAQVRDRLADMERFLRADLPAAGPG
jgi:hypothetical protein